MSCVEHFGPRTASDKKEAGVLVYGYTMRPVLATGRRPFRDSFAGFEIDRGRHVFVLVVHIEAATFGVDCIAFRPSIECQFFLLSQGLSVENSHGIVTR